MPLKSHKLYWSWRSMKLRCYNKNNHNYKNYGGRGIKVCDRWRSSFANFLADMGERPFGHTLNRINNDGNYEPLNCKWSDGKSQCRNQRNNHLIEAFGKKQSIIEWAEEKSINASTLWYRLKRGWNIEDALTREVICR